jgi:hypothetical protein
MTINVGDRIIYQDEDTNGVYETGEIVDIWNNNGSFTGYFAALDSGLYVHIKPNYQYWRKLTEPALVA